MPEQEPSPEPQDIGPAEPIPMARVWQPPPPPPAVPPPPPPAASMPAQYANAGTYSGYGQYGGQWMVAKPSRPGTITMLGIMSIVVASATLLGCLVAAFEGLREFGMAQMSRTMVIAMARQQAAQSVRANPGLAAGPRGLASSERDVAISVFASRQSLNNARQAQLDSLLAQAGQTILNVEQGAVTSSSTRAVIRESAMGRSPRAGESGASIFTTDTGTMEIYDNHAIFRPADHGSAVRAAADVNAYLVAHDDPTAVMPPTLATPPTAPVPVAVTRSVGTALGMVMLECAASAAVAVYLLVVGIMTLKASRLTGLMHWIYVPAKILLIIWAVAAWAKLSNGITAILASSPPGPWTTRSAPNGLLPTTMSVLAGGYVIMVVVLLLLPATREYYKNTA